MVFAESACKTDREASYERPDISLKEMRGSATVTERRLVRERWLDGGSYNGRMSASIEWQIIR